MLEGKIVLVASASRRIGRRIALILGQRGAAVTVNYNGSAAKTEKIMKGIKATGGKTGTIQCNVFDFESCDRMTADIVSRYDRLDILVNNTGIIRDNLLMKISEKDFDAVIDTNLKGVFDCIKHISCQMSKQKAGRIINISSVSGILGNADQTNYCVAKVDVIGIAKSTARELASRGVTVNAVAPGFIATEMADVFSGSAEAAATEQVPMKHFGSTQDITETVTFLASDKAGCITGQVLSVNGGMAM